MNTTIHNISHRKLHVFLSIAGLTGIAVLFLPFTFDISPLTALQEQSYWKIAAPAFLAVFISFAAVRWIISGSFSKAEVVIAYIVSTASAFETLSFLYQIIRETWPPSEFEVTLIFVIVIPLLVLLSGSWLVISKLKHKISRDYCPIIALQVAYLADCLMCLILFCPFFDDFFTGWQIGAWFSIATAVIYLVQIYLYSTQKDELSVHDHESEGRN